MSATRSTQKCKLKARKKPYGIEITWLEDESPFSVELRGHSITPLSSESLRFRIDGVEIELLTIPLEPNLSAGLSDEACLEHFRDIDIGHHSNLGWSTLGSKTFSFSSGEKCLSWCLGPPETTDKPEIKVMVATIIHRSVLVLVGFAPDPNGHLALANSLENILLTLNREPEVESTEAESFAPLEAVDRIMGKPIAVMLQVGQTIGLKEDGAILNEK